MKCTICSKQIVLVPSARKRARKCSSGYSAKYYTRLFTTHSECYIAKREQETSELMKRVRQ